MHQQKLSSFCTSSVQQTRRITNRCGSDSPTGQPTGTGNKGGAASAGDPLASLCSEAALENAACLSHCRRHILDIIPAVASHRALRFLRHKMERQELTNWEVTQTVLVALHSSTPTRDVMEEATVGFSQHSQPALLILASVVFIPLTRWQRL